MRKISWFLFVILIGFLFVYIPEVSGQNLSELRRLSPAQFDSIPELARPFNAIVKENCLLYVWPGHSGSKWLANTNPLDKDEIVRVIKEYNDYFFVKQCEIDWTGWVEKKFIKKNKHPDMRFKLEFIIGDSTGAGILTSPVRVSSDNRDLYVLEVDRNLEYRIQKFNSSGEFASLVNIPIKKRKENPGYGTWTSQENILMKVRNGYLFVPTEAGIGKFALDGSKLWEIRESLVKPVALDIAENGDIYILDDESPPLMSERTDIFVKIYSSKGEFLRSFKPENLINPTDIKVRDSKIYILGKKVKTKKIILYPISDIPIYSEEGAPILMIGRGEPLILLQRIITQINNREYRKVQTEAGDTGFVNKEMVIPVDYNVLYILNQNGIKIEKITFRDIAKNATIELANKIAKETQIPGSPSQYHWHNVAIDDSGNIYILWRIDWEDYRGINLIKFNVRTSIVEGPLYTRGIWFYGESPRSYAPVVDDNDLESYKGENVLFIDNHNHQVYVLEDSKLRKAVKDVPKEGRLNNPTAIAIDKDGSIYVSDFTINKVKKFTSSGKLVWSIGGFGKEEGKFDCVGDIAIDDFGDIYIADLRNWRVQKFDSNGNFVFSFPVGRLHEWAIFDIKFSKGTLKVACYGKTKIFNRNGKFIREQIDNRALWLDAAGIDKDGNLWKYHGPDGRTGRGPSWPIIWVYSTTGEVIDGFTSENFKNKVDIISDLEFDSKGNLWIADPGSYQVKKFSIVRKK